MANYLKIQAEWTQNVKYWYQRQKKTTKDILYFGFSLVKTSFVFFYTLVKYLYKLWFCFIDTTGEEKHSQGKRFSEKHPFFTRENFQPGYRVDSQYPVPHRKYDEILKLQYVAQKCFFVLWDSQTVSFKPKNSIMQVASNFPLKSILKRILRSVNSLLVGCVMSVVYVPTRHL